MSYVSCYNEYVITNMPWCICSPIDPCSLPSLICCCCCSAKSMIWSTSSYLSRHIARTHARTYAHMHARKHARTHLCRQTLHSRASKTTSLCMARPPAISDTHLRQKPNNHCPNVCGHVCVPYSRRPYKPRSSPVDL